MKWTRKCATIEFFSQIILKCQLCLLLHIYSHTCLKAAWFVRYITGLSWKVIYRYRRSLPLVWLLIRIIMLMATGLVAKSGISNVIPQVWVTDYGWHPAWSPNTGFTVHRIKQDINTYLGKPLFNPSSNTHALHTAWLEIYPQFLQVPEVKSITLYLDLAETNHKMPSLVSF